VSAAACLRQQCSHRPGKLYIYAGENFCAVGRLIPVTHPPAVETSSTWQQAEAAADFEKAASLKPIWAEPYDQGAGVYVDCPDPAYRNPEKAVAFIEHAIALDVEHPTYLTVLALAYFRSGKLEKAVVTQGQALGSPKFPLGYLEEATAQLR